MSFEEKTFFDNYQKANKKKGTGIPGVAMNAPIVTRIKKGDIGLELEVEAENHLPRDGNLDSIIASTSRAMWNAKNDGSLRGHCMEYVVSQPIFVDEVAPMVGGLFDAFAKNKTKLANTNRCSTHVHINIGGYTVDQLTAIIALWTTFEEALITWCGEARINNHYSLSSKNSVTMLETWENFLRNGNTRFPEGLKYSALNLNTIWSFGSVEFRCGPAADRPEIPIKWASFLYYLSKYAVENYKDVYNLPRDLSELGGRQLFRNICLTSGSGDDFYNEVIKPFSETEFNDLCLRGFRNAQTIVLGFPWDKWRVEIDKEYVPQPFGGTKKKLVAEPWPENPEFGAMEDDAPDAPVQEQRPRRRWILTDVPREAHRTVIQNSATQAVEVEQLRRQRPDVQMPFDEWERQEVYDQEVDRFIRNSINALGMRDIERHYIERERIEDRMELERRDAEQNARVWRDVAVNNAPIPRPVRLRNIRPRVLDNF